MDQQSKNTTPKLSKELEEKMKAKQKAIKEQKIIKK